MFSPAGVSDVSRFIVSPFGWLVQLLGAASIIHCRSNRLSAASNFPPVQGVLLDITHIAGHQSDGEPLLCWPDRCRRTGRPPPTRPTPLPPPRCSRSSASRPPRPA